jgi:glutamine amidotransferase
VVVTRWSVAVVDSGLSNIDSVLRAVADTGGCAHRATDPSSLGDPDRMILPGVGSFATAATILHETGLAEAVRSRAGAGVPLLGICLGMQLLMSHGDEGGGADGLGLIPGRVERLRLVGAERLPHVGWNEVVPTVDSPLFRGVDAGTDFYFVHSYCVLPADPNDRMATTPYGGGFASVVGRDRVVGVQFHPEKSHGAGLTMLRNFLEW